MNQDATAYWHKASGLLEEVEENLEDNQQKAIAAQAAATIALTLVLGDLIEVLEAKS